MVLFFAQLTALLGLYFGLYCRDMEGTCNKCHTDLAGGGILFTPPGNDQTSQNLCMNCFESMNGGDVKAEQAI